jgi:hydrogenase expression/formation protein HypC
MCLAVPSKIVEIENNMGTIDVDGVKGKVSLLLLEDPKVGDYVIVHAGFAMQQIDEEAAEPPEEPPGTRVTSQGLFVVPYMSLKLYRSAR